jgi:hypothetical protein
MPFERMDWTLVTLGHLTALTRKASSDSSHIERRGPPRPEL